jgi:hypothetical protein
MEKSTLTHDADMKDIRRQTNPDLFTLEEARDILTFEGFVDCGGHARMWEHPVTHIVAMLVTHGPNDTYIYRRMGHMDNIGPHTSDTGDASTVITTPRVGVERQRKGHYFLMLGDGPTPTHILEFKTARIMAATLKEAMGQLLDVAAENGD